MNPAIFLPFLFLCVCLSCSTKWKVPKQAMWCFAGSRDPSGISSHKDPPIHGGYLGLDHDDDNCPSLLHTKYFLKEKTDKNRDIKWSKLNKTYQAKISGARISEEVEGIKCSKNYMSWSISGVKGGVQVPLLRASVLSREDNPDRTGVPSQARNIWHVSVRELFRCFRVQKPI